MNRRHALLVLVALLVLANLVGLEVLREAWNARHEKVADPDRQAVPIQPVNVSSGSELFVARTGERRAVRSL
ncbi:MAG: hypothetical protein LW862_10430 [Rubrivivax sp.]|jgi:hypothetical protein|nr:hypothetical protein [Rubrivivax sp.]